MNTINYQSLSETREDIAGQTIKIGDYVVYSSTYIRRTLLNFAKVVGLGTKKNPKANNVKLLAVTYGIDWGTTYNPTVGYKKVWYLRNKGKCVSINIDQNVLLINENQIPNDAYQLLLCANAALKSE